jgi:hypothetical protein
LAGREVYGGLDGAKAAAQADYESRIFSALSTPRAAAEKEADDWRDDPSADERWNAGLDFAMGQFCAALGVDPKSVRWDAATETLDGDVNAVIWNILRARFGEDWDPAAVESIESAETADFCRRMILDERDYWLSRLDDDDATEHLDRLNGALARLDGEY